MLICGGGGGESNAKPSCFDGPNCPLPLVFRRPAIEAQLPPLAGFCAVGDTALLLVLVLELLHTECKSDGGDVPAPAAAAGDNATDDVDDSAAAAEGGDAATIPAPAPPAESDVDDCCRLVTLLLLLLCCIVDVGIVEDNDVVVEDNNGEGLEVIIAFC